MNLLLYTDLILLMELSCKEESFGYVVLNGTCICKYHINVSSILGRQKLAVGAIGDESQ